MVLVTVFCPLTITGAGKTVLQPLDEARFVVDFRVSPAKLVGHDRMIFDPEQLKVNAGENKRLKTVPEPPVPP